MKTSIKRIIFSITACALLLGAFFPIAVFAEEEERKPYSCECDCIMNPLPLVLQDKAVDVGRFHYSTLKFECDEKGWGELECVQKTCHDECWTRYGDQAEATVHRWSFRSSQISNCTGGPPPIPVELDDGLKRDFLTPQLNVEIPGLSFSPIVDTGGILHVDFLSEYIAAVYQYSLGAAATLAIVIIMIGGVQYMIGASAGSIDAAKKRIINAVTGLILIMSAYVILSIVNPNLTFLDTLQIKYVEFIPVPISALGDTELDLKALNLPGEIVSPANQYLNVPSWVTINNTYEQQLYKALEEFNKITGEKAAISSGVRKASTQVRLFWEHCVENHGICRPPTGTGGLAAKGVMKKNADGAWELQGVARNMTKDEFVASYTPMVELSTGAHLSSMAIDIFCTKNQKKGYIIDTACQIELTKALLRNGFCRLSNEAWHFEWNEHKVSKACSPNQDPGVQILDKKSIDFSKFKIWNADGSNPSANILCKEYDETEKKCLD